MGKCELNNATEGMKKRFDYVNEEKYGDVRPLMLDDKYVPVNIYGRIHPSCLRKQTVIFFWNES